METHTDIRKIGVTRSAHALHERRPVVRKPRTVESPLETGQMLDFSATK